MNVIHWIGTKPLIISLVAQVVVLAVAMKRRDRGQLAESGVLAAGLVMVIVGIAMRPPQPEQTVPDVLGTLAAAMFLVPAVKSLSKLREGEKKPGEN